ncbi:MAG: undecaprenyl-diphosphate phosphatase [Opitutales bacterium]
MQRFGTLLKVACLLSAFLPTLTAQAEKVDAGATPIERQLTYTDAILLGVVEGITEYLPVSSTGHLILTNHLLGLDADTPLQSKEGKPVLIETNSGEPVPFTLANAADAYAIIIQFGAIIAVALLYWQRLLTILMGLLGKDPQGLILLRNLLLAFLPAAVLGLLLDDFIESVLFGIGPVVIALIAGALLMLAVTRWHTKRHPHPTSTGVPASPDLHELRMRQCLLIGLLQCVAMWPGTSRSMMTIVGGYIVGLCPVRAAEFSFLLGLITLSAASAYKMLSVGPLIVEALPLGPVLLGIVIAALSAGLAVKWLVNFLTRHGLSLFAWYRIGLAGLVLLTFL